MKRITFLLPLIIFIVLLPGCNNASDLYYDYDAFLATSAYADEIIPAVEATMYDLRGWVRDREEPKRIEWFIEKKDLLISINNRHLTDDFPSYIEIEQWCVPVKRGDQSWNIEGSDLAGALEAMISATDTLINALTTIIDHEGFVSKSVAHDAYNEANSAVKKMKELYYNEKDD